MAAVRVELQGLAEKEEKGMQRQTTRARIAMFLIMFTTPLGSPLYFLGTLFYQLCLVSGKLTIKACVVTYIALVFFAVAWIPWVNFALYLKTRHDTTGDTETAVNGIAPIVGLYIFCAWGFVVAFRHFSIADSYEHEYDRASIRHLKGVALDPPVVVDGETRDSREILTNAFTLYRYLKGDSPPYVVLAMLGSAVLAGGTVFAARRIQPDSLSISPISILSTIFFCGMFLVFYSTLAFVVILYLHQVRLTENLVRCLTDPETHALHNTSLQFAELPTRQVLCRQRRVQLSPTSISHLRAWDEVRRVAVAELTSPYSVLNSFFAPTMALMFLSFVVTYTYLVVRLLFLRGQLGVFTLTLALLAAINLLYILLIIYNAKRAQKHFKHHTAVIAKISYDVGWALDRQLHHSLTDEGGAVPSVDASQKEELFHWVSAMTNYMVANQPRPLLLGIELRHVRYAAVFLMLLNGNILFFSLVVAFPSCNSPLASAPPSNASAF